MKRTVLLLTILLVLGSLGYGQEPDFWILLSDKDDSPYSLNEPLEFLSQRALDRRLAQDIALDSKDLPVNPQYVDQISSIDGVSIRYASKWFNAVSVRCDSSLLPQIQSLPFVYMIKSNQDLKPKTFPEEQGPVSLSMTARLPIYGASANQVMDLNGQVLHNMGYEGEGMVMAILDSGFDHVDSIASFQHLFDTDRILSTRDFVEGDLEVYDEHSHGRSVLSTIAAIKPNEVYGTAVNASFHLLRTEDVASETTVEEWNWIAGAEYADSVGADVLNTSLGYTTMDTELESYTYEDMDGNTAWITRGADIAASRGMLVVNSAGNSGASEWFYIGAPADGDSVLAIGAIDADSSHTSFSSHGPTFDGRVKPNVCAQGREAFGVNRDDLVVPMNGTSFSSPILAGLATCLWQAVPEATNMQVFDAIEMSAHLYEDPNDSLGYGIPDFGQALEILEQSASSVKEFEGGGILIYPNPVENEFFMAVPQELSTELLIYVYDVAGREVAVEFTQTGTNIYRVQTANLEKGIYFLALSESGAAQKFIKK